MEYFYTQHVEGLGEVMGGQCLGEEVLGLPWPRKAGNRPVLTRLDLGIPSFLPRRFPRVFRWG